MSIEPDNNRELKARALARDEAGGRNNITEIRNKSTFTEQCDRNIVMSYHPNHTDNNEDYGRYIQYISSLDISSKEKFELLYIVNSILSYFVDQAFGVLTDQITLASAERSNSNSRRVHDTLGYPETQSAAAKSHGADSDSNPIGPNEP